jgi:glycosyltransferase involved in cell wall biosynthesis
MTIVAATYRNSLEADDGRSDLHVCMLQNNYLRSGGATVAIRRIVDAYPAGARFSFVGCSHEGGDGAECIEDFSWMPEGTYQYFGLMALGPHLLRETARFSRWIANQQVDIIHVHHRRLAVIANMLAAFTKVPVLYTAHVVYKDSALFRYCSPRWATGVSPSVVSYLKRCTRASNPALVFNPYPFGPVVQDCSAAPPRAMTVGRMEEVKGHAYLIEAWKKLRDRGIELHLDIFGEGHLRSELERQARSLDMHDLIHFHGYSDAIVGELREHRFNVLVSRVEGFPNVVIEAAAQGVPSLLTDVDGSRDTIPSGGGAPNGLPFGDVNALVDALVWWSTHPQEVRIEGFKFYEHLRGMCEPGTVGKQYKDIYLTLVGATA